MTEEQFSKLIQYLKELDEETIDRKTFWKKFNFTFGGVARAFIQAVQQIVSPQAETPLSEVIPQLGLDPTGDLTIPGGIAIPIVPIVIAGNDKNITNEYGTTSEGFLSADGSIYDPYDFGVPNDYYVDTKYITYDPYDFGVPNDNLTFAFEEPGDMYPNTGGKPLLEDFYAIPFDPTSSTELLFPENRRIDIVTHDPKLEQIESLTTPSVDLNIGSSTDTPTTQDPVPIKVVAPNKAVDTKFDRLAK